MRRAVLLFLAALLLLPAGCPPADDDDDADGNRPPTAAQIVIEPAAPEAGDAITAFLVADSWDADGDAVTYLITWYRDGVEQSGWAGPTIDPGITAFGDTWRVVVVPTDGMNEGPASSASVTVGAGGDDDDSGDDDDDTSDDDDDSGDDDDDSGWPATPWAYYQTAEIDATGGDQGGNADVRMTWTIVDQNSDPICDIEWLFDADHTWGPAQGPDLYQYIDEVVVWNQGAEAQNSCPESFQSLFGGDPWQLFQWVYHPMAFVSCDLVADVQGLAATFLGDDVLSLGVDGTFGSWCTDGGPALQTALGSGPMEGIWLMGGPEGLLDGVGDYDYFIPASQKNVDAWMLLSVLMADAANGNEPTEGLEGEYVSVPIWMWVF